MMESLALNVIEKGYSPLQHNSLFYQFQSLVEVLKSVVVSEVCAMSEEIPFLVLGGCRLID